MRALHRTVWRLELSIWRVLDLALDLALDLDLDLDSISLSILPMGGYHCCGVSRADAAHRARDVERRECTPAQHYSGLSTRLLPRLALGAR
jgi:hypothetical protein